LLSTEVANAAISASRHRASARAARILGCDCKLLPSSMRPDRNSSRDPNRTETQRAQVFIEAACHMLSAEVEMSLCTLGALFRIPSSVGLLVAVGPQYHGIRNCATHDNVASFTCFEAFAIPEILVLTRHHTEKLPRVRQPSRARR
jgi:hypothetical protein